MHSFQSTYSLFLITRSVHRSGVGSWFGLTTHRTSFGAVIDIFKTRNKQCTLASHLPYRFCALSDWFLWITYGPDNCVTVNLHCLKPELNWKQVILVTNFCFLNFYCWLPDASSRAQTARGCETFGISSGKVSSLSTLLLKCWAQTANMLLSRLSPGDACARLEGELDPIVAVRE